MKKHSLQAQFSLFLCLTCLHMLWVTWDFFQIATTSANAHAIFFHSITWVLYSFLYAVIGVAPAWIYGFFHRTSVYVVAILSVVSTSFVLLFISADRLIYDLYVFHFNGFIWNLLTTKGGVESLGTNNITYISITFTILLVICIQLASWLFIRYFAQYIKLVFKAKLFWSALCILFVTQAAIYGISDINNDGAILDTAIVYPFYKKITFRTLANKAGFHSERPHEKILNVNAERLRYPIQEVKFNAVTSPPNIIILVAESLRWDRLTPEIMPNVWSFSQQSMYFKNHYSSGNGTREGLFGLFYGLYGSYWSSFLHAHQPPLLMDRLAQMGYVFDLRTSARFSYPEFNKTIFANIPVTQLHEANSLLSPWERDEVNTNALISFLRERDKSKPFMSFFFFESTHARYEFPEQAVIARPYLKDINYWGMNRKSLKPHIKDFKNRYTNAAHWVDTQMGRIVDELKQQRLLENTIIVITGDHGEEFLEKGFWGHNSSFVDEQIRTPLVMHIPQEGHGVTTRVTSHLDVSPTLLHMLGSPKQVDSYSLGQDLRDNSKRDFIVISDWHSIAVLSNNMKYRIQYLHQGIDHYQPTTPDDKLLTSKAQKRVLKNNQKIILAAIKNTSRFIRK